MDPREFQAELDSREDTITELESEITWLQRDVLELETELAEESCAVDEAIEDIIHTVQVTRLGQTIILSHPALKAIARELEAWGVNTRGQLDGVVFDPLLSEVRAIIPPKP